MSGPIGLHGGGEYLAGDEPFLDALLDAAEASSGRVATAVSASVGAAGAAGPVGSAGAAGPVGSAAPSGRAGAHGGNDANGHGAPGRPIRVVLVPTAAARGRPDRAAEIGRSAFERRAAATGRRLEVGVARIVDSAGAADADAIAILERADLIHLPGGDPDLIPAVLGGTPAAAAIEIAWQRGAVLAGASAGAMALAEWTWTPGGGIHGLGFVDGLAVVPHYDDIRRTRWQRALDELAPGGIGYLGLDERTGILSVPNGHGPREWRVAGRGAAYWFARGAPEPLIGRHGDVLQLPA